MFGYVRVRQDTLPEAEKAAYEAAYCGLCRSLGENYGARSRFFLNYDFAFLAMLLAPSGTEGNWTCRKCAAHPIVGRKACVGGGWLNTAGAESVILTYWKLKDNISDDSFFARIRARGFCLSLKSAYGRARKVCPAFDRETGALLADLRALERENCPSLDRTADCFARLLRGAAPPTGDQGRDRATGELLYHVGRWIYLIDAVDDLEEDRRAGRYNPVLARFPQWTQEDKAYLRQTMDHSLALAGAAFQLLEANPWSAVVENVLYSGLPGVEELVFSGKWREDQKKYRRNDG